MIKKQDISCKLVEDFWFLFEVYVKPIFTLNPLNINNSLQNFALSLFCINCNNL